jgi:hypothetical protein
MTSVEGTVKVDGVPARIATVEVLNPTGDVIDQVRVDDHGHYMYHLAAGNWAINAYDTRGHRATANFSLSDGEARTVDLDLQEAAE